MSYIAPSAKPLKHLSRLLDWESQAYDLLIGGNPPPVTIEWDLSNRCVLGCQDCHFAYTHTRGPWSSKPRLLPMAQDKGGDLADIALVKRALQEASLAGVQAVVWTGGGEPTTHPEWREALKTARAWALKQGMYTYGGLLDKAGAIELADACEWVVVSLDAWTANIYAAEKGVPEKQFEAACRGILYLTETQRTIVGVSFLLHEANWRRTESMLKLSRSLGATYTTFRPTIRTSPTAPGTIIGDRQWALRFADSGFFEYHANDKSVEADRRRFVEYANWDGHPYPACYGIRLNTTITPDGRVWLCPNRREMPESCLGDLRVESFADIWKRHPGKVTDYTHCRAMCRLHPVNQTLDAVYRDQPHAEFI